MADLGPDANDEREARNLRPRLGLLRGTTLVAIALAGAQVAAYLVNIVSARALGPDQFGILSAMLGLILIGNVVALALQAVIARLIVHDRSGAPSTAGKGLRFAAIAGLAVMGAAVILMPFLGWFLQLNGLWPLVWVAVTLVPLTIIGAELGIAQGSEAFSRLAGIYLAVGLGRGIGGVAGALVGQSATAVLIGIACGTLVGAGVGRVSIAPLIGNVSGRLLELLRPVGHATHALLALFLLTNIDVVYARAILTPQQAGDYGVGAILAKIAFWLPQFVGIIAFPRFVDARRQQAVTLTLASVAGIGAVVVVATAVAPNQVVAAVGGSQYESLASIAWIFALIGALMAVAQALLLTRIAVDDRRAVIAIWVALATLTGLAFWVVPANVAGLAVAVVLAASLLCVAGLIYAVVERRQGMAPLNNGPTI